MGFVPDNEDKKQCRQNHTHADNYVMGEDSFHDSNLKGKAFLIITRASRSKLDSSSSSSIIDPDTVFLVRMHVHFYHGSPELKGDPKKST